MAFDGPQLTLPPSDCLLNRPIALRLPHGRVYGCCGSNSLGSHRCFQCHYCRLLITLQCDCLASVSNIVHFVDDPFHDPFHGPLFVHRQCPQALMVVVPDDQYPRQSWIVILLAVHKAVVHTDCNPNLFFLVRFLMGRAHSSPMYTMFAPIPIRQMSDFVLVHFCPRRSIRSGNGLWSPYIFIRLRAISVDILDVLDVLYDLNLPLPRLRTLQLHVVTRFTILWSYGIQSASGIRHPRRTKPELGSGG